jgi:transposase
MKTYSNEFKFQAVKRALEPGAKVTQVALDLGVHYTTLKGWIKNYQKNNENPFIGSGHLSPKDAEIRRLMNENRDLKEENDILKKAASYFARNQK